MTIDFGVPVPANKYLSDKKYHEWYRKANPHKIKEMKQRATKRMPDWYVKKLAKSDNPIELELTRRRLTLRRERFMPDPRKEWDEIISNNPLRELEKVVLSFEIGSTHDEDACKAGVIVLAALFIGADIDAVEYYTRYDRSLIELYANNFTHATMWIDGKTDMEWLDAFIKGDMDMLAITSFWCSVMVGMGILGCQKVGNKKYKCLPSVKMCQA